MGTSLLVPEYIPESRIEDEIDRELIDSAFSSFTDIDRFTVPGLSRSEDTDHSGKIRCVTIPQGEIPSGWKAVPLRQAMLLKAGETLTDGNGPLGRLLRACHIGSWRRDSRYCGSCGGLNTDAETGELARQCTICKRLEFPRITPAVITIITNDKDQVLLAHNKMFPEGLYSLIAGFNEAGENLEASVAREIKEEVNLEVKDIHYIASQPWPFPYSLMLGFSARYAGGKLCPDGKEIVDAKWFSRDCLPILSGYGSMSRYLIDLWKNGQI